MTTERKPRTIADIARLAGVSKSTVSRALNDSPLIGVETKERIREIAREHDFRLNAPAQRLSLRMSGVVGLVSYGYGANAPVPDAFMLELMGGITAGLEAGEYDLLVIHIAPNDTDWVARYREAGRVDGFILLSAMCTRRHLDRLVAAGAPFVIWGPASFAPGHSTVSGDNLAGGRVATAHLTGTGRRRIAFLGGPEHDAEVDDRYRGYELALADAGLPLDPALVVHASWHEPERSSAAAVTELLDRAPDVDAVFANSDLLAIGAMEALRTHGRAVPDDVAVIGYDDIAIARYTSPPLTTIRQDGPLAGKLLARSLVQQLETGVVSNLSIPAELVVRGSA
jgi:DNA-binding LacI/PurR family transcriptional regulator